MGQVKSYGHFLQPFFNGDQRVNKTGKTYENWGDKLKQSVIGFYKYSIYEHFKDLPKMAKWCNIGQACSIDHQYLI